MQRRIGALLAVAMVLTACTGQDVPGRTSLPPVGEYQPTEVYEIDPTVIFPNDGTCVLAAGEGAKVLDIMEGFPAEDVFQLSDLIVEVDGFRIASTEALLTVMAGRPPGDEVHITIDRHGEQISASLVLQAGEGNPDRGLMGIVPTSAYSVHEPPAVPLVDEPAGPQRHIFIGDDVYLLDPLSSEWQLFAEGVASSFATVALGREIYILDDPTNSTVLEALGSGERIEIDAGDWRFVRPLATVGELILMSAVKSGDPDTVVSLTDIGVVGVDLQNRDIAWEWRPGTSPNSVPVLADTGFRSPSGAVAALTLSEIPAEEGATPQRFHVLIDGEGNELTGWGTAGRAFVPDNAVLSGFFAESILMYGGLVESGLQLAVFSIVDGSSSELGVVELDAGGQAPRYLTVGDGRHLLALSPGELQIVDAARGVTGRPIVQGCDIRIADYGFGIPSPGS